MPHRLGHSLWENLGGTIGVQGQRPSQSTLNEEYGSESNINSFLSQFLGSADVFDSQSIADALTQMYGFEEGDLTAGMFPPLSKDLLSATKPETYDAYRSMMRNPLVSEHRSTVEESSRVLNPNKRRRSALNAYSMGVGNISRDIFSRTSAAGEGVRDWMNKALGKVFRMKY